MLQIGNYTSRRHPHPDQAPPPSKRHKSAKPHAPLQDPSPTIDGGPADIPMLTCLPATGGDLVPPDDTRTGESAATDTAPLEAATRPETDPLQDLFRAPLEIPGCKKKKYVYRHADACISDAHKERYPQIIDLFRQKLLTVKALSKSGPAHTLYKMKLCGSDRENTQPSILIFHPWIDQDVSRHIWKNLRAKSLREQYELIPPVFGIHIFFSHNFWMLGNSMKSLSIHMDDGLFVGARLVSNDTLYQVSTITCGISFAGNNTIFALTSAHAFEDNESKIDDKLASSHNDSTMELGSLESDDMSEHSFSSTDDEYDWDALERAAAKERQGGSLSDPNEPAPFRHEEKEGNTGHSKIEPSRVWGRPNDLKCGNLDWALVEISSLDQRTLFAKPSDEGSFIKSSCPSKAVGMVVVVATASGLLKGTLSGIQSYLASSRNSTAWTKIWTLTLADDHQGRLHKGDSGSPVLDVERNVVYGYVTTLNPFGELHVMPLPEVLNQIWEMVQPPNHSSKLMIFDRVGVAKSTSKSSATSAERWPTRHLFQHWPGELGEVQDNESADFSVSPPNDAGNNPSILEAITGRLENEDGSVRGATVELFPSYTDVVARREWEIGLIKEKLENNDLVDLPLCRIERVNSSNSTVRFGLKRGKLIYVFKYPTYDVEREKHRNMITRARFIKIRLEQAGYHLIPWDFKKAKPPSFWEKGGGWGTIEEEDDDLYGPEETVKKEDGNDRSTGPDDDEPMLESGESEEEKSDSDLELS